MSFSTVSSVETSQAQHNTAVQSSSGAGVGNWLKWGGSSAFGLVSHGVGNIISTFSGESSLLQKVTGVPVGLGQIVLGAVGTAALGIPYVVGNMLVFSATAEGLIIRPQDLSCDEVKSNNFTLFDLNAALGQKFLQAINLAGTGLDETLMARADRILDAIGDQPDMITFQEVFDPVVGEHMAQRLGEKGYTVVYGAGKVFGGVGGYNSGLFTAVHKRAGEITGFHFQPYSQSANEEMLCAKGLLKSVVTLKNGETLILANTHLQASGSTETQVRQSQMREASEALQVEDNQDKHILLVGDMNPYNKGFAEWNEVLGRQNHGDTKHLDPVFAGFSESHQQAEELSVFGAGLARKSFGKQSDVIYNAVVNAVDELWEGFAGKDQPGEIADYLIRSFLGRQCFYKAREPHTFTEVESQIDAGLEEIRQHRATVLGSDYQLNVGADLSEKIKRLLQRRNDLEIVKEARALEYVSRRDEGELPIDFVSRTIAALIKRELTIENLEPAFKESAFLTKQLDWYGRHFNDRIITKTPAGKRHIKATYRRDFSRGHLSDHLPLVARICFK